MVVGEEVMVRKFPRTGVDHRVVRVCFVLVVASKGPGPSVSQCLSFFCYHVFCFQIPAALFLISLCVRSLSGAREAYPMLPMGAA